MSDDKPQGMTYKASGVDYDAMDPYKRMAQLAGRATAHHLTRFGFSEVEWSRGESAYVIETPSGYIAFVVEGLGTKNLVADAVDALRGMKNDTYYDYIAQCNVAMAVNDLITSGAMPLAYSQYLASGNSEWFENETRCQDLVEGTKQACNLSGCAWGGGETPTLKGIVDPATVDLAGATVGWIADKKHLINPANIQDGDNIIMFTSSGLHSNGYTMARKIADKLPNGYRTDVYDTGRTYGEMLLTPTYIYVDVIRYCQMAGVNIHYAVNITGHGWRKLMRANGNFAYVVDTLPPDPSPIFRFMQEHGPISDKEAYNNLNMSAGFAIYVPPKDTPTVLGLMEDMPFRPFKAGHIEAASEKRVEIVPKGITFTADTLGVR